MAIAGYAMGCTRGLQLHSRRNLGAYEHFEEALKEAYAAGYARQEHPRHAASTSTSIRAPRLRRLHLRRGDGAAGVAGRQEGPAALQAAVPGELRPVRQAHHDQQHRDLRRGAVDHAQRRRWFLELGKPNNGGTKIFSVTGDVEQARQLRGQLGHAVRASCWKWPAACAAARKLKAVIPGRLVDAGAARRDHDGDRHGLRLDRQGGLDARLGRGDRDGRHDAAWCEALLRLSYFYSRNPAASARRAAKAPAGCSAWWTASSTARARWRTWSCSNRRRQHRRPHHLRAGRRRGVPVQSFIKHFRNEFEYHIEHKTVAMVDPAVESLHECATDAAHDLLNIEIDGKPVAGAASGSMVMDAADKRRHLRSRISAITRSCRSRRTAACAWCEVEKAPQAAARLRHAGRPRA